MGMRRRMVFRTSTLAVTLLVLAGGAWAGSTLTVPSTNKGTEGNSDNLYPLNGDPIRYQQVIAASEFSTGAGWITQFALRPDAASGAAFSETLTNVQINLSTTKRPSNSLSKTFASNVGSDETVVSSGALALSSAFSGPDGGPKDFDIIITLKTPFWYDPSAGNLLIDVRNFSGGRTSQLDAQDAPDTTSRIWSLDVDSPTAASGDPYPSAGLVIQFFFN
jgi:hypothetical protein